MIITPTTTVKEKSYEPTPKKSSNSIATKEKVWKTVQKIFLTISILFEPLSNFFTQALSDFLCLETLRHGTGFSNYLNIRVHGADPNYGGKANGSSHGMQQLIDEEVGKEYVENSKGYFHVFKDSGAIVADKVTIVLPNGNTTSEYTLRKSGWIEGPLAIRLCPRMHAFTSGYSLAGGRPKIIKIASGFLGFFTPTIKARYQPEEIDKLFENDPDYFNIALRTKKMITPDRFGFIGVMQQGVKGNITERIKKSPGKSMWGLIRLINPIGLLLLAGFGINCLISKKLDASS